MKRYTLFIQVVAIVCLTFCCWLNIAYTASLSIEFATELTFPIQSSFREYGQQETSQEMSSEGGLMLPFDDHLLTIYQHSHLDVHLSLFKDGQEEILWKNDDVMELVGAAASPILGKGHFNLNNSSDILFCYTEDFGIGQSAEHWKQYLLIFFDGKADETFPILLSASDWSVSDEPPYNYYGMKNRPGSERRSFVLLVPESKQGACTLYVWSRVEIFEHLTTNTSASITFLVEAYTLQGTQIVKSDTLSGSHQQTLSAMQSILTDRQEGGEELFFLDFLSKYPLKTQEEWLSWWGMPE